jgi:molybdate transport system substrate-binding protein
MKKFRLIPALLIILALVLGACAPAATPTAQPAPTEVPVTQPTEPAASPTAAPTAVPATETAAPAAGSGATLTVMAASSLTESFTEIGAKFEAANPGVKVAFNFAGSQQLATQITSGAPADVFASASKKYMDNMVTASKVDKDSVSTFSRNRLVVIYPTANPGGVKELKDLAKSGLKLVLAAKEVPVGQYALTFLDNAVKDGSYGATYKDDVLKNVVSYEDNVKSVLSKVALGEADAGIVYVSDVTGDSASKVTQLEIPDSVNSIASYPIAALKDSTQADLAKAFVNLVLSADGQAILASHGFMPAK